MPAAHEIVEECRPDVIIHLAARAGVRPSIALPRLYTEVNVLGTLAYFEAACRLEPRPRFIYASSSSVYGDRDTGPFRESDPAILPVSPYAATKRSCELLAHTFHHLYRLPVTGLRFFTSYGPRNRRTWPSPSSPGWSTRVCPCPCSATARAVATTPTFLTSSTASSADRSLFN